MIDQKTMDHWFRAHVATRTTLTGPAGEQIEQLVWKNPASWVHAITYRAIGGVLIVTGDMYDAIYISGAAGLDWWKSCDADYFAGKCVASPYGRGYRVWDQERARRRFGEYFTNERDASTLQRFRDAGGEGALSDKYEWIAWMAQNGVDVFGPEYYEYGSIGDAVAPECVAHLYGLRSALTQLAAKENVAVAAA